MGSVVDLGRGPEREIRIRFHTVAIAGPRTPPGGYRELAGLGGGLRQGHVNGKRTEPGENIHVAVVGRKYDYYYEIIKLLWKLASRKQNSYSLNREE